MNVNEKRFVKVQVINFRIYFKQFTKSRFKVRGPLSNF